MKFYETLQLADTFRLRAVSKSVEGEGEKLEQGDHVAAGVGAIYFRSSDINGCYRPRPSETEARCQGSCSPGIITATGRFIDNARRNLESSNVLACQKDCPTPVPPPPLFPCCGCGLMRRLLPQSKRHLFRWLVLFDALSTTPRRN